MKCCKKYSQNCQLNMFLHVTTKLHVKMKLGNLYGRGVVIAVFDVSSYERRDKWGKNKKSWKNNMVILNYNI